MSQVVLSLVLPVPMIALFVLVRRPGVMAGFAIDRATQALAATAAVVVLALNAILLLQSFGN
jgi:manganese transport protein